MKITNIIKKLKQFLELQPKKALSYESTFYLDYGEYILSCIGIRSNKTEILEVPEIKEILLQFIKDHTTYINIDENAFIANTKAETYFKQQYKSITQEIRNSKDFSMDNVRNLISYSISKLNVSPLETAILESEMEYFYLPHIQPFLHELNQKHHDVFTQDDFIRLDKLIKKHLRKWINTAEINKDENNMYEQSWMTENGLLLDEVERLYFNQYIQSIKHLIIQEFSIDPNDFDELIDNYIEDNNDILHYIFDLIKAKNGILKKQRSNNLLELNDKIGDETNIDYDITNDYVRNRPIIILENLKDNKPYVFFGQGGASHSHCLSNIQPKLNFDPNRQINPNKMGYGYLLGNIAFVDEIGDNLQVGYTKDEIVNILKQNPKIKKVYTTPGNRAPGGGKIKRLAKKVSF